MKKFTKEWQENHNIKITFFCPTCNTIQKHSIWLPCEYIDFIMKTALFGSISHWCFKTEAVQNSNFSDYELISRDGSLLLYVRDKKEVHILNLEKFLSGFVQAYIMSIIHHWKEHEENNIFTISSRICDTIIQFAIFGKIRFKKFKRGDMNVD